MAKMTRAKIGFVLDGMTRPNNWFVRLRSPCRTSRVHNPFVAPGNLMRDFVADDTSGWSRNAFETVITETPACRALCL